MGAEILVRWQHSVPELALPMAGGRDPVGRPQRRPQQRDGHTAHKERHKEQRASLEVHPGQVPDVVFEGYSFCFFTPLPCPA